MSHYRKHASRRYKGPRNTNHADHSIFSTRLREVRDLTRHKQFALALAKLNALASSYTDAVSQSRIASAVGDVEFIQGKYTDAIQDYRRAKSMLPLTEQTEWFRASLGEVQSLLKNSDVVQATTRSQAALAESRTRQQAFDSTPQTPALSRLIILERPLRPTVVATRLGYIFLAEGEVESATQFFNQALQENPAACRARIGLAMLAEKQADAASAGSTAREAIIAGLFRAQTVSAWPILVRAQLRTNGSFDETLLLGLQQATPSVRARAVWSVVKTLRALQSNQWIDISGNWLNTEGRNQPIMAAEMRKVFLADSSRSPSSFSQEANALALFSISQLAPREWLFATKRWLADQIRRNLSPDVTTQLQTGIARYGENWRIPFTHGIFKACLEGGNAGAALPLLQAAVNMSPATEGWHRAVFALARTQKGLGNTAAAADLYLSCAIEPSVPLSFRVAARLKRSKALVELGDSTTLLAEKSEILALLNSSASYNDALDLAYGLTNAPKELNDMAEEVFAIGKSRALALLNATQNPSNAATILFKLARREADFGKHADTIAMWSSLSAQKKLWLWSQAEDFWQYLSFVFEAYRDTNDISAALSFAQPYIDDVATPPIGLAILGILVGLTKVSQDRFAEAFADFERFTQASPATEIASYGYYWLALREWKSGNSGTANDFANKMDLALGNRIGMKWKAELKRAVICIRSGMNASNFPNDTSYSTEQLTDTLARIDSDLERIPTF